MVFGKGLDANISERSASGDQHANGALAQFLAAEVRPTGRALPDMAPDGLGKDMVFRTANKSTEEPPAPKPDTAAKALPNAAGFAFLNQATAADRSYSPAAKLAADKKIGIAA